MVCQVSIFYSMNESVIILTTYTINGSTVSGSFPIWVQGVSQCCTDENGELVITPISVTND